MNTFKDFQNSRHYWDDLNDAPNIETGHDDTVSGYVYLDSFYIEHYKTEDSVTDGLFNDEYVVILGNGEFNFADDLLAAERFLWTKFAMIELQVMKPCRFYFGDDPTYDGFTDGTTWNGFDNVWVTAETHKAIVDHFTEEYKISGYHGDELTEVMQSFDIEPDDDGLYSYAYGFATSIDEDDWHIRNR